jgi:threonine/homoserine/homoserine lactone efflux protein
VLLGLTAGISPGPLLALVISETLKHGRKEGIKIAVTPLITDLPIIVVTLFLLSRFVHYHYLLGIIAFTGALFIAYLGYESISARPLEQELQLAVPGSLKKGILANVLNPHPYLFWLTVGAPLTLKAYHASLGTAALYIVSFYSLLIGSKIAMAWLVDKSRALLKHRLYTWIMKVLGIALFVFAGIFIYEGVQLLGGK